MKEHLFSSWCRSQL